MTDFERRMYKVCEKLWADSHLLAIVWSYKDTQSDSDVLEMLDARIAWDYSQYEVIAWKIDGM